MYFYSKRVLDVVIVLILIVVFLPVIVIVSSWVKINDPTSSVLFKQKRVGKDGEVFKIYKFRTMIKDADKVLKSDNTLYKKYLENSYKLDPQEDPRITKLGIFLRKTSLDELPQLFNVLKGDMSLVGPRPVLEDELKEYGHNINKFLSVKPGVTGYWQVSGRSEIGYPERVEIELYYVDRKNTILDLFIIFKTVAVVLKRQGAY